MDEPNIYGGIPFDGKVDEFNLYQMFFDNANRIITYYAQDSTIFDYIFILGEELNIKNELLLNFVDVYYEPRIDGVEIPLDIHQADTHITKSDLIPEERLAYEKIKALAYDMLILKKPMIVDSYYFEDEAPKR